VQELAGSPPSFDVVVVGSVNQDYLLRVARAPAPGETVTGATLSIADGGKGANQAVAAAKQGVSTALVARVGDDPAGELALSGLRSALVDTEWTTRAQGSPTGAAFITITPDGENRIVVAPGANSALDTRAVDQAGQTIADARVLVLQLEVVVGTAAAAAGRAGPDTTVILNAAPAVPVPADLLERVDVLVVNEQEAATLVGRGSCDPATAAELLRRLGPAAVVVTSGQEGAMVVTETAGWVERAPSVIVGASLGIRAR
jgi:ribokinase